MTKRKSFILTFCMALLMCLCLGFSFSSGTMTAHASSGTPITELTVSGLTDADVPQIGKNATMPTLTLKESGLKISRVYWFCLNTREEPKATDKFESGYTYALRLQYSVLDGYEGQITEPSKIKLDGVTASYTLQIDPSDYINFIFNVLGNEELSLVNPEHLQIKDGYVGAHAATDYIHVKGGKFPYTIDNLNIQCPSWLTFAYNLDDGKFWRIQFYGTRPTTPTPSENFSFTITDADGTSKTFTGTTGETKENPDAIQNIVVNYNLPDVGATSPTEADLPFAITLSENIVCKGARLYKTDEYSSTTPFTFEKWGKYTLRLYLETTNGKLFAGDTLLKGYLVSNNNFSYSASFGNYTETSLILDFDITKYGVTTEELDNYKMTTETLKHAKVGVLYNEKIEFTKPAGVEGSDIKIECLDTLYGGLSVDADGTITGTPDDRVYYNWGKTITLRIRYVYKTYILDYKEYELVVEGYTQISRPSGKTLGYNGNEQIGVEEGEGYTLSGTYKATDIGEYTAIAQLKPGFAWGAGAMYSFDDREITWKIVKGEQPAPTGITTEQATVEGKNDSKILGVTTDMTYSRYNEGSFRDCTGTTIENLASGKYEVRYKENANYNIGEPTVVEITNKYEKTDFKITTATLPNGKCGVEYNAKIDVACPTGNLSKVEIKNYNEADYKVYGLNIAKDGTISGKPDKIYGNGQKNVKWIVEYYYDGILMEQKTYFLNIDGYTVLSFVSGNQNLIYDGSEQIGVSEDEGYTLTGTTKATDAGNYVATAKLKPGYKWDTSNYADSIADYDVQWTIAKADKDAPVGVKGFNTSNVGVNDGKITGVTTDIEYRVVGGSGTYADCTGAEITGLAKGQYEVRYKESKNYKASAHVTITIAENEVITYTVTVTKGTGGGEFEEGASVTLTANTPGASERFTGWTLTGVSVADTTQTEITFNMPANAVTATANYEDIEYSITVNGGTENKEKAKYGETITINATVPTGKKFVEWTSESGNIFADKKNVTTTFTMPAGDVTVVAKFEDELYRVDVTEETTTLDMATYQTEVTVKANEPATDMYFDKWEVTGLDTTDMDLTKTEIKFNMPAGNVTFKATYLSVPKYDIIMVDGTKDISPAKAGETITITAKGAPTGKVFDKWTCETAGVTIEFASATSSTTTFVMPASEITIQAHFRDVGDAPSVEIKVKGGTGAGVVKQGDTVTIIANAPAEGKRFKHWENASGEILSTKATYEFSVRENITLTAVYEDMSSGGGEITPPAKKDGLSGGQIAGIVIGMLLLAGIGGFAIYWFAISKKTFADLGTAFKKFFEKIKNLFKKKK